MGKKTTQRLKKMTGTHCLTSKYRGFSMVFLFFLSPITGMTTILTGQTGQTMNPSMFVVKTFQNRHKIPWSSHVHDLLGSTWWFQPENYESQLGLSSCCLYPHYIPIIDSETHSIIGAVSWGSHVPAARHRRKWLEHAQGYERWGAWPPGWSVGKAHLANQRMFFSKIPGKSRRISGD